MNRYLKEVAERHGDRLQIVSINHLEDLKKELEEFRQTESLNDFQKWIMENLYDFNLPVTDFEVKSIIIMALYHPMSTDVEFKYEGKAYRAKAAVGPDIDNGKKYLYEALSECGYHAFEVYKLPMKRLAVQSGLAVYGKNNITYVEGLGSNVIYLAFYSDAPCEEDVWTKLAVAECCQECNICVQLCPTGAISENKFLLDNQRCLSYFNEMGGKFPDWLPKDIHHTIYDCLRCQEHCPMNSCLTEDTVDPILITEEETKLLLQGKGSEDFPKEFLDRVAKIDLFSWKDGLARNIRAVIEATDIKKSIKQG